MESIHIGPFFEFNSQGRLITVEENTPECIAARVTHICVCPEGFREDNPSFGIPELAFSSVPINLQPLEAAIKRSEPEATLETIEQAIKGSQASRAIGIEVS